MNKIKAVFNRFVGAVKGLFGYEMLKAKLRGRKRKSDHNDTL